METIVQAMYHIVSLNAKNFLRTYVKHKKFVKNFFLIVIHNFFAAALFASYDNDSASPRAYVRMDRCCW